MNSLSAENIVEIDDDADEPDEKLSVEHGNRPIFSDTVTAQVSGLHDKFKRGKLIVQPDFQRDFVWDKKRASKLIESSLLRIPIPIIYISEEADSKQYVIDGQQRLTSFFSFIDGKFPDASEFKLAGLEVLKPLNGKSYADLPESTQDKIRDFGLTTVTFKKESDENLKFEIFERLNTGSVPLNDQELRNCIYRGPYNNLVHELSEHEDFRYILNLSGPDRRRKDVEFVLRFSAFFHATYLKYKPPMKRFLNSEAITRRQISAEDAEKLRGAFKNACQMARSVFGKNAFKRFYRGDEQNTSGHWEPKKFNASLYDVIMYTFATSDKNTVIRHADQIREGLIEVMTSNREFIDSIELSTSSLQAVKKRFDIWRRVFDAIVQPGAREPRIFSREIKERLFNENPTCEICSQKIHDVDDAAVDHKLQFAAGGPTALENARLTPRYCNWARPRTE